MKDVYDKDLVSNDNKFIKEKTRTIDLHGFSLIDANIHVKKIILDSIAGGYTKIKVITGKGLRSKARDNPYISSEFSILKNSVPEFIKNDRNIFNKIKKIYTASQTEGGGGVFYILLKKVKE